MGRALALVTLVLAGCDGCGSGPAAPDLGATSASRRPAVDTADPSSPLGRAVAHARALPEARERAARRAVLLSDGRRHGRAGRHAEALRSFEDALRETEGPDAALHCEAGSRSIELGQWPLARRHLLAGLTVAVQPRRRAACLYDLARVQEAVDDRPAAIAALRESLELRPNAAVERKLRSLEAAGASASTIPPEADAEGAEPEVHPSLEALCSLPCTAAGVELPALPDGWPELALVDRPDADLPAMTRTWLAANDAGGWRAVDAVAASDGREVFGAQEAREAIARIRFEDGALVLSIVGSFDEASGEADAYFACAREHGDDEDAAMACFDDALPAIPPPESWSYELTFRLEGGRVELADRIAGSETQAPVRGRTE